MIEIIVAFIVGWMLRPLWELFLKPILKNTFEAYFAKRKSDKEIA
jgi:hypothetical protein